MKTIKILTLSAAFLGLVLASVVFEKQVSANTYYFELYSGSDFIQNWSDSNLITIDDNWTTPLSVQGFRGDGLTASTGTDPRTILVDGQLTPLDVNANQTNPNTYATGGVTEFEITDPTIALKGSGTADAPHLMIYLNTTPCPMTKSISISYNVRDIDGSANDAVQPVALHYRIGTTGNFTNVPAGYIADATEPNAATKVTSVLANLPPALIGLTQVELRIMTTNAVGTDEWVGIDDLRVGCYVPTAAGVSAGGRVLTADGQGIPRATIKLFNTNSLETRYAATNQFGYFLFDELEIGGLYIATVGHKIVQFTNHTQSFQLVENISDLNFIADSPDNVKNPKRMKFR